MLSYLLRSRSLVDELNTTCPALASNGSLEKLPYWLTIYLQPVGYDVEVMLPRQRAAGLARHIF